MQLRITVQNKNQTVKNNYNICDHIVYSNICTFIKHFNSLYLGCTDIFIYFPEFLHY